MEPVRIINFLDQPFALATGQIDILLGVHHARVWNIISEGADFRIISGGTQAVAAEGGEPARNIRGFVVRKELYDSGQVRGIRDLVGRKVANFGTVPPKGERATFYVYDVIFGELWGKINWVRIPNEADILTALKEGLVDAAYMRAPWFNYAVKRGIAVELFKETDNLKKMQSDLVWTTEKFLKRNPEAVVGFLRAYLKALQYVREVQKGQHLEEYKALVAKYTDHPVDIALEMVQSGKYTDEIALEDTVATQQYYVKRGIQKRFIPLEQVINLTFLEKAKGR